MKFVCVIGSRRTGSNRICSLLSKCGGLNVKYELFHRTWSGALTPAEQRGFDAAANDRIEDDAALRRWRTANPSQTLDVYYAAGERQTLVFKLFPEHLPRDAITRELLARDDMGFLILRRRPIESYISDRKAETVQCYHRVDTTDVKPSLEAEHFLPWAETVRDWYAWAAPAIAESRRPCVELSYDNQFRQSGDADALGALADAWERLGLPRPEVVHDFAGLPLQDREPAYRNRVANWEAFAAALRSRTQNRELLEWAETAPSSEQGGG